MVLKCSCMLAVAVDFLGTGEFRFAIRHASGRLILLFQHFYVGIFLRFLMHNGRTPAYTQFWSPTEVCVWFSQ